MSDEWRQVIGFDAYDVSNAGSVRRRIAGATSPAGKVLRPAPDKDGYLQLVLRRDGKNHTRKIHRLVCEAWHGPQPSIEHEAAHFDGIVSNNAPSNLRWATPTENSEDKRRHGRWNSGEKCGASKLSSATVLAIRAEFTGARGDLARLSERHMTDRANVAAIVRRRTWKHI